jgi:hypothetical protein
MFGEELSVGPTEFFPPTDVGYEHSRADDGGAGQSLLSGAGPHPHAWRSLFARAKTTARFPWPPHCAAPIPPARGPDGPLVLEVSFNIQVADETMEVVGMEP